jgi:hypothetical protein
MMGEREADRTDAVETIEAIRRVRRHLNEKWISEGCRTVPSWGCVSCRAVALDRELELFLQELQEYAHAD